MYSDGEFPDIRDLLCIADMVSNNVHYLTQLEAPHAPSGPWGTVMPPRSADVPTEVVAPGGVVAPVARKSRKTPVTVAYNSIPPSVRKAYTRLRSNDIFSVTGPLYRPAPEYRNTALATGWEKCIETVTVSTMAAMTGDTAVELSIPLSPVRHDNTMLTIGNVSRATGKSPGECTEGENCEALMFAGNTQKLQPYYTPSQWSAFHLGGAVVKGRCLLCIRKIITNVVHLNNMQCLGTLPHTNRPPRPCTRTARPSPPLHAYRAFCCCTRTAKRVGVHSLRRV